MSAPDFAARVLPAPRADGTEPTVPGLVLGRDLARGATTQVRAARDGNGREVAVLLREDTPVARERAQAARRVRHAHLLPVEAVLTASDGRLAVVTPLVPTTLAGVLRRTAAQGPLTAGELAGLLDALGHALGCWHEHVGPHGDVRARNVLVDATGRVVLGDLFEDPAALTPPASRAGDVADLARLLSDACQEEEPPPALRRALAPASSGSAAAEDARALAAGAAMIAPPQPLDARRLPMPGLPERARAVRAEITPHRRTVRVSPILVGCVAAGLLLGVGGGLAVRAGGAQAPDGRGAVSAAAADPARSEAVRAPATAEHAEDGPDAAVPPVEPGGDGHAPVDPGEVATAVTGLVAARDAALRAGDDVALAELTVPGTDVAQTDRSLLAALREAGERVVDHTTTVTDVELVEGDARAMTVRATFRQEESVRAGAGVTRTVPAQEPRCVLLDLDGAAGRLRLQEVRPCD